MKGRGIVTGLFILILAAPLTPAFAQAENNFTAEPAKGSSTEDSGYFILETEPGQSVRQAIVVGNRSNKAMTILIAPVDATTGLYGGVDYGLADEETTRVGTWIDVSEASVEVAPGERVRVPFVVQVPSDAAEGQHLGGLAIGIPKGEATAGEELGEDEAGAQIIVESRRVIAVQVELPGDDEPELEIQGVEPIARADGVYLEVAIANVGRGLTKGEGTISVGDSGFETTFGIETFVPGTEINYPIRWRDQVENGEYQASVEISYADGAKTAEWSGTFSLGDEVQEDLSERAVGGNPNDPAGAGDGPPLVYVGVGVAILALGGFAFNMRRQLAAARAEARLAREGREGPTGEDKS